MWIKSSAVYAEGATSVTFFCSLQQTYVKNRRHLRHCVHENISESFSRTLFKFQFAPASKWASKCARQRQMLCVGERLTHRVQQNSEKELPPIDELVQFVWAAWVVFVEDGVCEKTTSLPGQHLQWEHTESITTKAGSTDANATPALRWAAAPPGGLPPHTLFVHNNVVIIQLITPKQTSRLLWVYMVIHGNACTVKGIRGAEYQSSVRGERCPFRLWYLKDGKGVLRPEHRRNKESGLRLISTEGQLGKKWICFLLNLLNIFKSILPYLLSYSKTN